MLPRKKIVKKTRFFLCGNLIGDLHSVRYNGGTDEAALLGGSTNRSTSDAYYDYDLTDSQELGDHDYDHSKSTKTATEEIPDPSPLVLPGYNLPENIFNHGKPFYVEKDPLTGKIDFSQKSPSPKLDDDLYDYVDEEPSHNIYDKSNIDRKDGSLSSHKHSDVNQLTPNFHDFLNLPVKYNSAKYVYPLISSSYASTKIQGSVNKFHNHKDYATKTTTYKPTVSPTYYSTSQYFSPVQTTTRTTSTTTTPRPTTTKVVPEIHITSKPTNLLNTEMGHPNFMEDFEDYYDTPTTTTKKHKPSEVYLTTENVNHIYLTTKAPATTTKKPMSLFEQLFGEYDDTVVPAQSTTTARPSLFSNLPSNKYNKYPKTEKPATTTTKSTTTRSTTVTTTESIHNSHGGPNVLVGNMGLESNYEYEDYGNEKYEDNIAVQTKPIVDIDDDLKIEPLHPIKPEKVANPNTEVVVPQNNTDYYDYSEDKETTPISITTPAVSTTTSTATTVRVTSLPLGDNHLTTPSLNHFTTPSLNHFTAPTHNHFTTPSYEQAFNRDPIIVATQNLREKLNSERVQPKPFEKPATPPSTTNVHIAHDQDIVSFVVGNQQNVDGGQYDGPQKESSYGSNPFRPLYGQQGSYMNSDSGYYKLEAEPEVTFQLQQPVAPAQSRPEVVGSAVTIQPLKHSEASLAIGVPVNSVKQVPGQVVDEKLDIDKTVEFPKTTGTKIVFPNEKEPEIPDLLPPPVLSNREVLQLNSKPMYHQLPSDLTPPREPEMVPPPRPDQRPSRPPWDPRPGHFYSGKPEYNRPPRPPSDVAYKRIDNLPNILPQFRPNMNKPPGMFYDKRLNRQPLLERPSNRPIAFFEKLQPPPPPPPIFLQNKNLHALRKNIAPPRQSLDDAPIAKTGS
ncbi:hypothetical protein JTB14_016795 [Gonioctena quinquepunctata]|nr:hypothetical protein JTB14_016795 [Gonioctena quinquepunctata]